MSTQNLKEKVLHSLADETLMVETTFQDADNELMGLELVKTRVKEIAPLLLVDRR